MTNRSTPRRLAAIQPLLAAGIALAILAPNRPLFAAAAAPAIVQVKLTEWSVELRPERVPPGAVVFDVTNAGTIPHGFEIEGRGVEKSITQLAPGGRARLEARLNAGRYEAYCPIGKGSHEKLGMLTHLVVGSAAAGRRAEADEAKERAEYAEGAHGAAGDHDMHAMMHDGEAGGGAKAMKVVGGGPVIQILPGPFPFADSAAAVIAGRPADQQEDLTKKSHMGPYSNNVAAIAGDLAIVAIDRGATGDSVAGQANFTDKDGARWKLAIDRVQTKDIPFNPRFGGVIMGLFYHGSSGVHTPLVPTIQSSLALWAYAHLYKNDALVSDDAMVHVMLLSRTRRTSDWALDCWDCSDRPVEELQLQVTPPPGSPPFPSPGGFLFVNWEKSTGEPLKP